MHLQVGLMQAAIQSQLQLHVQYVLVKTPLPEWVLLDV